MAKDANGTTLEAGDSVSVIKDLKIKGASHTLKGVARLKISNLQAKKARSKHVWISSVLSC